MERAKAFELTRGKMISVVGVISKEFSFFPLPTWSPCLPSFRCLGKLLPEVSNG